jgi:hypothetical protein
MSELPDEILPHYSKARRAATPKWSWISARRAENLRFQQEAAPQGRVAAQGE